jgi:hypothetical protein
VLREANRVLLKGGRIVLDLADGEWLRENFSPRSWEWIDSETFCCRERTLSWDKKRLYSREVVVVTNKGVVRDQFYSERLYTRQEVTGMARAAGFEVCLHDEGQFMTEEHAHREPGSQSHDAATSHSSNLPKDTVTAARELSQRGQDLGMMEQRLLVVAKKVRESMPHVVVSEGIASQQPIDAMSSPHEKADASLPRDAAAGASADVDRLVHQVAVAKIDSETDSNAIMVALDATKSDLSDKSHQSDVPALGAIPYLHASAPPLPSNHLTVIMGDPRRACREKLNGQWNQEDYSTRDRLARAIETVMSGTGCQVSCTCVAVKTRRWHFPFGRTC